MVEESLPVEFLAPLAAAKGIRVLPERKIVFLLFLAQINMNAVCACAYVMCS